MVARGDMEVGSSAKPVTRCSRTRSVAPVPGARRVCWDAPWWNLQNSTVQLTAFSALICSEHFDRPRDLWKMAHQTLKPDGVVATFVPNDCLERKEVHSIWGHVHPLLIDADGLRAIAASCGFTSQCYSLPYNLAEVQSGCPGSSLQGDELAIIAHKITSSALC